ncbi:sodium:solute symporter family protein [Mangrovactinospora gilvigrisea]|uniref:sodium:solute symporter family protein n=1 Tax=Mangrovactinospora gilvigrisea TaxID=1428644 RepID=UPI001FEB9F70|nr:sodium:solute symporter family protein [Mangrovactinospora gilvigrisea]
MLVTVGLGVLALRRSASRSLTDWSVGGRSLGTALVWVLMAGESYTSFSYLGAAGWGYGYGVPVLYVVAYLGCGYAVGYLVGPLLWRYARDHDCVTISDMVAHRFRTPVLGAAVAVFATVFLLPYIQLQLTGMGVVVSTISYGRVSLDWGYAVAFLVTTAFVVVSGLRGSAWVSLLKDVLVILTLLTVAVWIPVHFFGSGGLGYPHLLHRMVAEKPEWLTLPGHDSPGLGMGWFASTTLLSAFTITVFPTTVAGYLGAKNAGALRRNAIYLPFYQVLLFIPLLLGMAAAFVVPNLKDSNLALFRMVVDALPAWLVGLTGVAAALSSIVPMGVFMLVIGTMWGRSVLGASPRLADRQKGLSQLVVVIAGAAALLLTYTSPNTLVRLSVVSYEGMAQLLPVVLGGLLWRGMTRAGAVAGLAAGTAVMLALVLSGNDPLWGCNAGVPALAVNAVVNLAVSTARWRRAD